MSGTGDHNGRPYGFFNDIQRVVGLFHGMLAWDAVKSAANEILEVRIVPASQARRHDVRRRCLGKRRET